MSKKDKGESTNAKREDITLEEWRAEMERLNQLEDVGGVTVREMAKRTGHGVIWVQNKIRRLIERGEWACLGRKAITTIDSRTCTTPTYGPIKKEGMK